jgi:hypothetical protein
LFKQPQWLRGTYLPGTAACGTTRRCACLLHATLLQNGILLVIETRLAEDSMFAANAGNNLSKCLMAQTASRQTTIMRSNNGAFQQCACSSVVCASAELKRLHK